jgi:hypothetical protein
MYVPNYSFIDFCYLHGIFLEVLLEITRRYASAGKRFSLLRTDADRPWRPSSLLYNGYQGTFTGIWELGRGVVTYPV